MVHTDTISAAVCEVAMLQAVRAQFQMLRPDCKMFAVILKEYKNVNLKL